MSHIFATSFMTMTLPCMTWGKNMEMVCWWVKKISLKNNTMNYQLSWFLFVANYKYQSGRLFKNSYIWGTFNIYIYQVECVRSSITESINQSSCRNYNLYTNCWLSHHVDLGTSAYTYIYLKVSVKSDLLSICSGNDRD